MPTIAQQFHVAIALPLFAVLVLNQPLHAQEGAGELPVGAKASFERGVELFKEHDYSGALAEFLAAHEVKPHYSVLYNIAQCYAMLDQHAQALDYYKKYTDLGADYITADRKEAVQKEMERLQSLLCKLTITVSPSDAKLSLDGKGIAATAGHVIVHIDPGEHVLVVSMAGYEGETTSFIMRRDESKEFNIALAHLPEEPDEAESAATDEVPAPTQPVPEPVTPSSAPHPAGFWTMIGLTGALGIAASATGGMTLKKSNEFTSACQDERGDWKKIQKEGKQLAVTTDVLLGLTGAAAMTSIVLGILTFRKKRDSHAFISPFLHQDGAGVLLSGSF